jgi:hypothetical protein
VTAGGSSVQIDVAATGEQLLLVVAGVEEGQTAKTVAQKFVDMLRQGMPNLNRAC